MVPSKEDVIRVRNPPRSDGRLGHTPVGNDRLTEIGAVNVKVEGTNTKRTIPVPWVDCDACARRHYPSTISGRWHIATTCLSCGLPLHTCE